MAKNTHEMEETYDSSNSEAFCKEFTRFLATVDSKIYSKKYRGRDGRTVEGKKDSPLMFGILLGTEENRKFLMEKPNGSPDEEGLHQMNLLSKKLYAHLATALGTERYHISNVPEGDGIAAWRIISGAVDGNNDERIGHYKRQMQANTLNNQQGYGQWYATMMEKKLLINSIETVCSVDEEGNLNGQHKHFYIHEDNFKQEYYLPRVKKAFPEVFAKNLNDPKTPVESTEATVMSLDRMCRSIARENATDSKQASFINDTRKSPENRGRTKWRRTGKGRGKGSGGGKGYENSRSYGKGKGKGKGNGAGWGGWKPKRHCDNCQDHFDEEDDEESKRNLKWLKDSHDTKYCAQKGGKYENNLKGGRLAEKLAQQQRDAAKTQSSLAHHMKDKGAGKEDSDEDTSGSRIYGSFANRDPTKTVLSANESESEDLEYAVNAMHGCKRKKVDFAG